MKTGLTWPFSNRNVPVEGTSPLSVLALECDEWFCWCKVMVYLRRHSYVALWPLPWSFLEKEREYRRLLSFMCGLKPDFVIPDFTPLMWNLQRFCLETDQEYWTATSILTMQAFCTLFLFKYNLRCKERDSKILAEGIVSKRWDTIKRATVKIEFTIIIFTSLIPNELSLMFLN